MKHYLASLMVFISSASIAQFGKLPLDKGFIEKTIEYYYASQAKQQRGNTVFFIEKDSLNMHAKTDYTTFKVQFLSADDAARKLSGTSVESSKLDKINIKWVSIDTIDVVITGCTVGVRKVNKVVNRQPVVVSENFLTNCTEAWVDVPTCRFVYNLANASWTQVNRGKVVKKN